MPFFPPMSNANVHVYDVSLYQTDVPVLGDRIKVQLFTPLLTDANRIIYYVNGDGKNPHLDDERKGGSSTNLKTDATRQIHLVYNGSNHFNVLVPEAKVNH